ncbi:hypothetical protein ACUN0C_02200 [Faunimonas sp. B44]|uniref:hypothetical protein n=1 Tax=Faunimonas sp. B44 TaxID=3461493 RepID=UPI0040448FA6
MIVQSLISRHAGRRIDGYRNSSPRFIKVLALGPNAESVIAEVNKAERDNVLMSGRIDPGRSLPMDEPVDGKKPHAVIVVHEQGEQDQFPFLIERTASMLSFIVLENGRVFNENAENEKVRSIRAIADLFVTTSDRGFVRELVDNLAS